MEKEYEFENPINSNLKKWCQSTYNNSDYWYTNNLNAFPPFIQNEYLRLRSLLGFNQPFGFLLELKDVLELLIKTPVVLNLAKFVNGMGGLQENSDFYNVLDVVFDKLELGKWFDISARIINFYSNNYSEQEFVEKSIIKLSIDHFKDKKRHSVDITNWRNRNIGHGALNFNFDDNYRQEACVILKTIKYYMEKAADLYNSIVFYFIDDDKCIKLSEINTDKKKELYGKLYVKHNEEKYYMSPFLEFIDGRIYFYDAYNLDRKGQDKKNKTTMLEYAKADKFSEAVKSLNNLYLQTKSHCNLPKRIVSDGDAYLEDEENAYLSDSNSLFLRPAHLERLLVKELEQHNSGVFLLQMMSGMGKSTFTRMLDHNSGFPSKNHISLNEFSVRAYYLDSDYSASIEAVKNELPLKLRHTDNNRGIKGLRSYFETKEEFAGLLNKAHYEYLKLADYVNLKTKLLLIIDGLDELSGKPDVEDVFNIIPEPELLEDGVFILLTCRSNEELSDFICSKVQNLKLTKKIKVSPTDSNNILFINEYLQNSLGIVDPDILNLIEQSSEGKILRASLLRFLPEYIDKYVFLTDDDLCKAFLNKLNLIYTNKYFREVKNILLLLAMTEFPIRKDYFDELFNYNSKDFLVKGILRDVSPLISKLNLEDGTYYTISHSEFRKHIICAYGEEQALLLSKFMRECSEVLDEKENLDYKEWFIIYFVVKYLHAVLPDAERCLVRSNVLFKLIKLITRSVEILKPVQGYENYMAIEIANSCLEILNVVESIPYDNNKECPEDFDVFIRFASWYIISHALYNLKYTSSAFAIIDTIVFELGEYVADGNSVDFHTLLMKTRQLKEKTAGSLIAKKEPHLQVETAKTSQFNNGLYWYLGLNIPLSHHKLWQGPREYILGALDGAIRYIENSDPYTIDVQTLSGLLCSMKGLLTHGYINKKVPLKVLESPEENDLVKIVQNVSFEFIINRILVDFRLRTTASEKIYQASQLLYRNDFSEELSDLERKLLLNQLNGFIFSFNNKEDMRVELDINNKEVELKQRQYLQFRTYSTIFQALYFLIKNETFKNNSNRPFMYCIYYTLTGNYLGIEFDYDDVPSDTIFEQYDKGFYFPCTQIASKQEIFDINLQELYQCRALESCTINALLILVDNVAGYYSCDGNNLEEFRLSLEKIELFPHNNITIDTIKEIYRCLDEEYRIIYKSLDNHETKDFSKIFKTVISYRNINKNHKKILHEYVALRERINSNFNVTDMQKKLQNICFDKKLLYLTNELKREVIIRNTINQIGKDTTKRNCVMDLKRADWRTLTYANIAEMLR